MLVITEYRNSVVRVLRKIAKIKKRVQIFQIRDQLLNCQSDYKLSISKRINNSNTQHAENYRPNHQPLKQSPRFNEIQGIVADFLSMIRWIR